MEKYMKFAKRMVLFYEKQTKMVKILLIIPYLVFSILNILIGVIAIITGSLFALIDGTLSWQEIKEIVREGYNKGFNYIMD